MHLVETMAYNAVNGAPWHGLGVPVTADLTPEQIAVAAGIDWQVTKFPVYYEWTGAERAVPGRYALVRRTDGKVLDIVGEQYTPTQNRKAIEFFRRFTAAGAMAMETAGSLDGGRRIWALAKIHEGFTLPGDDRVEGYLLLSNPHRQGEAITAKLTAIRVVCNNTLNASLRGAGAAWRLTHWHEFDERMQEEAAEVLGLARDGLLRLRERAEVMAAAPAEQKQLIEYVAAVSGSEVLKLAVEVSAAGQDGGSILDRMLRRHEAEQAFTALRREITEADLNRTGKKILAAIVNAPGAELASARGTWWGALNGVTYVVDHDLGRSDDSRMTSAWFGVRSQLKQKAAQLAYQYASAAAGA
jgi:phage/plasmid-like protein (TIGR03299 family)